METTSASAPDAKTPTARKICIAHRGASAYAPEHTLAAYRLALEMGADYVEQDLQMTSDGELICLHDVTLERTTNVEEVFPDRWRRDPLSIRKRWYAVDFTLEEIKRLDAGAWFAPEFAGERVPTFREAIGLVRGKAGIYPETKEPGYYAAHGLDMANAVLETLAAVGLDSPEGRAKTPIIIQSFSADSLKQIRARTGKTYPLVQLISLRMARSMFSGRGLAAVAEYADGIGPNFKALIADPRRVERAHALGLFVHAYTVNETTRPEQFADVTAFAEYLLFDLGVDGVFSDLPDRVPRNPGGE